jgi:N-acetyl sugar amidotransferase
MVDQIPYKICTRCVMDTSSKGIVFDEEGVCSHCKKFAAEVRPKILSPQQKSDGLKNLLEKVRTAGKGRKYDCLIGLSGGMDSSYVVYLAKKHKLRAVVVHFDNGWDSELAVKNIENIIKKTGFDYFNYIVDWDEFRDLQRAYFKASVVDVEVPTDMGILSLIPNLALKFKVPFILFGENIETESTMGIGWNFDKRDRGNLEDIHKQFGEKNLKTFPYLPPLKRIWYQCKGIVLANLLAYEECDYQKIKAILGREMDWRDYGVKHGESVFTKFYQSYYLPRKFGIDKRRAHLSDQINSGHISRGMALEILKKPVYQSEADEKKELEYVLSKLGFSDKEFGEIMEAQPRSHSDFAVGEKYGSGFDRLVLSGIKLVKKVKGLFK